MRQTKRFFTLSHIVCTAVMTALAVFGRIAFAPVPNFKPTTAFVILAGAAFGPAVGGVTGALAALLSNFTFGQGLWTPVQMLAWGLIGCLAGLLTKCKFLDKLWKIVLFGLFSSLLYGMILDTWHIFCYVRPLEKTAVFAALASSVAFNAVHAFSTVLFLSFLAMPFLRRSARYRLKYMDLDG